MLVYKLENPDISTLTFVKEIHRCMRANFGIKALSAARVNILRGGKIIDHSKQKNEAAFSRIRCSEWGTLYSSLSVLMPSGIVFSLSLPAQMQIIVSAFLSNKSKLGFGFFSKLVKRDTTSIESSF